MTSALTTILNAQHAWAAGHSVEIDRGCTRTLNDNLFQPLHEATQSEFETGKGDETGRSETGKKRAKMLSLRSSSVLVANVFDYWRGRDLAPLAFALGAEGEYEGLRFEQPFDHGLSTGKPHLDVVLFAAGGRQPFAIEAKFTEPYSVKRDAKTAPIAAKYFLSSVKRWQDAGLPRCQLLAESLGKTAFFHHLDAVQLLKHLLGLSHDPAGHASGQVATGRVVTLSYLWFDTGCNEARNHRAEIAAFNEQLDGHVDFRSMTYQELFDRLTDAADAAYVRYLEERYFSRAREAPRNR